jgi:hypothetical protein
MRTKRSYKATKVETKNKTKKNKSKYNTILSAYIISNSYKDNEKNLACFLSNNNKIKQFAFKVFYYMLNYWKTNIPNKWTSIIKHSLIQSIDKTTILKIGFTATEFKYIIDFVTNKDKNKLFDYLNDKFLKVTASINSLCEPEYTIYHVSFNKYLQNIFLSQLEILLFVKNVTWNNIMEIYNSIKNKKEKEIYNFFIFDLIYGADKDIQSIYRDNLGNMSFFRNRLTNFKHNKQNYKKLTECNKSIINVPNYHDYGIYNSTERYKIMTKSPYAKIMKTNNSNYIGGPSGSTGLIYIMLFHFYNFPFSYKNKIMLLGLLIADYIPLWHTIPEILLSAYPEFKDTSIKKYSLDQNAVLYSIHLLTPFIQ